MKHEHKTACYAAVAALSGFVLAGSCLDLVYRTTISREMPKMMRSKMTHQHPLNEKRAILQHELEQKPHELVSVTSHDGLQLYGHWFAKKDAKRTILLMHGWRSSWARDFAMQATFLLESDSNLLFVEQCAQGRSEGKNIGFGILERHDCLKWLDFVQARTTPLPVFLFGTSMGASTVLMASGMVLPSCVKGVIADSGYTDANEIIYNEFRKFSRFSPQWLNELASAYSSFRSGYSFKDYSPLKAMKTTRTPTLFIHGSEDTFVPTSMSLRNYEACKAEKSLLIVDGATHIKCCLLNPELYSKTVMDFIHRFEDV